MNFARLVHIAEGIKIELTDTERVERCVAGVVRAAGDPARQRVDRATFNRLIKDKVDRTIDCCHEALARARERAGLRLGDIDYVVLVGGSSRVPLVRDTRARPPSATPDLPEHVRCPEPLLHEPDLCVAYGAALRAATHGTRYLFPMRNAEGGMREWPGVAPDQPGPHRQCRAHGCRRRPARTQTLSVPRILPLTAAPSASARWPPA